MADKYGALVVPIPAPGATAAVADPLLDTLLSFFAAVIVADTQAAWAAVAPGFGSVVKAVFAHDPGDQAFKETASPALYLWREQTMRARQLAAEWRIRPSRLVLRWVPPRAMTQDRERRWEPFFNALPSVLDRAIERGRHPAWVAPGDTDPRAATEGSLLWTFATVHKLEVGGEAIQRVEFSVPLRGQGADATVEAIDIPLELEERLVNDVTLNNEFSHIQIAMTTAGGDAEPITVATIRLNNDPD